MRLRLGEFELDPAARRLTRGGVSVHLTRKPFQVLLHLVEHRDRLVARTDLLKKFWKGGVGYEEALTRCVSSIRKALDDQGEQPRFIETRWAEGYRYVGPYAELAAEPLLPTVPEPQSAPTAPSTSSQPARLGRRVWIGAAALLLAAAGAIYLYQSSRAPAGPIRSIAVLPFKNVSGDAANDYLSDGITDGLITALSAVDGLKVVSHASVFHFKERPVSPQEAGRTLDVSAVLEGSVRKDADSARIVARLVSTEDGRVLWIDDSQDRPLSDLQSVQDTLTNEITAQLRLEMRADRQPAQARPAAPGAAAHELYLKGRYFWNRRTEPDMRKSISYFEQAVQLEPSYALAHAGLADAWLLLPFYGSTPNAEAYPRARAAAQRALEIDPSLAEAHAALALVRQQYDYDAAGAEAAFKRALALNPNYATGHQWYSELLSHNGRFDEAVAEISRARELDPLSLVITTLAGSPYLWRRDYPRALQQYQRALELDPEFALAQYMVGLAYDGMGRHDEAIEIYRATLPKLGLGVLASPLIHAYARAGRMVEARQVLEELLALSRQRYVPPFKIATAYAASGHNRLALEWLERAYEERDDRLVMLRVEPQLDGVRQEPRFIELERKLARTP